MRKLSVAAVSLVLVASSCMDGGGGDQRTVLVDFSHDEFASFMIANFPDAISVTPGTELVFKQTWTGEPHTVTGGTLVNEMMEKGKPLLDLFNAFDELVASGADLPEGGEEPDLPAEEFFRAVEAAEDEDAKRRLLSAYDALREEVPELPDRENPGDATNADLDRIVGEEADAFFEDPGVPWAFDETEDGEAFVPQNAGQPCYLTRGGPPEDSDTACRDAQQRQPVFDGSHSYYNSGIIPYEGPQGNTFRVELADDIEPGSYFFYCAVHGPGQATEVTVRPEGSDVPSQEDVSRQAREEIARFSEPMQKTYNEALEGRIEVQSETIEGPFAGLSPPVRGTINEFVPKELETEVGEEVTWKMMGAPHTISFDVPEYFPIIQFADDGRVALNPRLQEPAGGAPDIPEPEGRGAMQVDGGTYDGERFWSSGLLSAPDGPESSGPYAEYTIRFSRPGTYRYACLLHPPMVGSVEVTR